MQKEIWKSIPEIDGIGEISNKGRFKYTNYMNNGYEQITTGILNNEWMRIHATNGCIPMRLYIHRLVALAFIPIPEKYKGIPVDKLEVHHKDFNSKNNCVENLEWLTHSEHRAKHDGKTVYQYGLDGTFIREHDSISEAARFVNTSPAHISRCCNGKANTASGFKWSFNIS